MFVILRLFRLHSWWVDICGCYLVEKSFPSGGVGGVLFCFFLSFFFGPFSVSDLDAVCHREETAAK